MANLRIVEKGDFVSDDAAISGSSEVSAVDLPIRNVVDDIRSRPWRVGRSFGYFRVWSGGPNQNDYLDVDIGGGEVSVQLTRGEYTASGMASEIQTQLQTISGEITCTYSANTNKFTIAKSSGTLTLKILNGTNLALSAWSDMGFATSADKSGGLSYESDNKVLHMEEFVQFFLGTVTIRDVTDTINGVTLYRNDMLNFKESATGDVLTIIIPAGSYTFHGLLEEIEQQMRRVGDSDYEWRYDVKSHKIIVTTDGDYLSLLWKTGTNGYDYTQECWYLGQLLGIDDATPADDTGATSYTFDYPVYPDYSTQQVTMAAIFGHTLSSGATIELLCRYAADIFRFDGSLESLNNPSDTMVFAGGIEARWKVKPGATLLGYGVQIT